MVSPFFIYSMIYITPIDDLTIDFATALYKHNNYIEDNAVIILEAPRFFSYDKMAILNPKYNKIDITGFYNIITCLKNIKCNRVPKRNYNRTIIENNKNIIKSLF